MCARWHGPYCSHKRSDCQQAKRNTKIEPKSPELTAWDANRRLLEVAGLALRLGFTAFGGPAAHIAMLRDEVVSPPPVAHRSALLGPAGRHQSHPRAKFHRNGDARWPGARRLARADCRRGRLILLPAAGSSWPWPGRTCATAPHPRPSGCCTGSSPSSLPSSCRRCGAWDARRSRARCSSAWASAIAGLYLLGVNELVLLFGGGLVVMVLRGLWRSRAGKAGPLAALLPLLSWPLAGWLPAAPAAAFNLWLLFLNFLKIGSVLYGSATCCWRSCAATLSFAWAGSNTQLKPGVDI